MRSIIFILLIFINIFTSNIFSQKYLSYPIVIKNMGSIINSSSDDYAPFPEPSSNKIYFTSFRKINSFGKADILCAKHSGNSWHNATNAGLAFNTENNDGSLCIAEDGKTVYFAADGREDGFGDTDLYTGELINGKLTNIKNLGARVNSKYWDSQPTISGDGTIIYFASNRPGGFGGTDIWVTKKDEKGMWSIPQNLGSTINTKKNDCSPYISQDGKTIFFSSDGFEGYGGKDIYSSSLINNSCVIPVNLGDKINSEADEMFFIAPPETKQFYFASSRKGGLGKLDIYCGEPNLFGKGSFRLTINIIDSLFNIPISGKVDIIDILENDTIVSFFTNNRDLDYSNILPAERSYHIEASVSGYPKKTAELKETPMNSEKTIRFLYGSKGMFRLILSVVDSICNTPVESHIKIVDNSSGDTIVKMTTNSDEINNSILLPPNRKYKVFVQIVNKQTKVIELKECPEFSEKKIVITFGPIKIAEFDLGKINIPFFVTGYYRPNILENLENLYPLIEGSLKNATYIERFSKGSKKYEQYKSWAKKVEVILDSVYSVAVENVFPDFKTKALKNEFLEIKVIGFADPQPIFGKYLEKDTIQFEDYKKAIIPIITGDDMDNLKLSGLRAYHSGSFLDKIFSEAALKGHPEYVELKKKRKIKYTYIGGDVAQDGSAYPEQRRIRIIISNKKECFEK